MTTPTGLKASRTLTATALVAWIAVFHLAEPASGASISHEIAGVNDKTFTVTWFTETAVVGSVRYGTTQDALVGVAHDDRGQPTVATTHHITVSGLSAVTTYYYRIVSDGTTYDDNGSPYELTTGPSLAFTLPEMISGRVFEADGTTPAAGAVVYAAVESSQTLSTLTDIDGHWAIDIAAVRTGDCQGYQPHSNDDTVSITIRLAGGDTVRETATISATARSGPDMTPSATLSADFTASPTSVEVGSPVQFTEAAGGGIPPYSYSWDFDSDGTVDSTEADPTRSYAATGTYSVTLRATDSQGATDIMTRTDYISVGAPADSDDPPVTDAAPSENGLATKPPVDSTPVAAATEDATVDATSQTVTLSAGSTTTPDRPIPGATDIVEESETTSEFNWWLVAVIAAAVVIIGTVVWQLRIRRY